MQAAPVAAQLRHCQALPPPPILIPTSDSATTGSWSLTRACKQAKVTGRTDRWCIPYWCFGHQHVSSYSLALVSEEIFAIHRDSWSSYVSLYEGTEAGQGSEEFFQVCSRSKDIWCWKYFCKRWWNVTVRLWATWPDAEQRCCAFSSFLVTFTFEEINNKTEMICFL